MKQQSIIIYHTHAHQIGGVETFLYNFCINLKDYYDITVLLNSGDYKQLARLARIVKIEKFNPKVEYKCNIFLRNSVWGVVPDNIKADRYVEMRHTDYMFLKNRGILEDQYHVMPEIKEIIACGKYVAKKSTEALGDKPTTILNILAPKVKTNKILRLISCTRLDEDKGWDLMLKLMEMLKKANIKFEWNIFTNNKLGAKCDYEEVHFYEQRFDIWDYLADADYTVLLSKYEGTPYTVQESLQYDVPCIVTDIPGCTELIKDGKNGYVVPLDMNFDVRRLLKIPKIQNYDNHAKEKWIKYLGNPVYKKKKEYNNALIEVTQEDGFRDIKLNRHVDYEEEYHVDIERAYDLVCKKFVKIKELY